MLTRSQLLQQQRLRQQLSNLEIDDNDDCIVDGGQDLHRGYSRPKLVHDDLSDYVKLRLLAARLKAMEKFREIHSQA